MAKAAKRDPRALVHEVLTTESSHMSLDEAVADFPVASINTKAPNVPFTFWHILEHIRIAQTDLLEYVTACSWIRKSTSSRPCRSRTTSPCCAARGSPSITTRITWASSASSARP